MNSEADEKEYIYILYIYVYIFIVALRVFVLSVMSNDVLPKSNACVKFESVFSSNL